ncbi:MAG: DNA polymerase III subunit alpha, partial [Nitrospirae bacterium]|nr:DNA polymerase III subunit alpha [Nitrospirota bacterium]
YRPGPIGGGMIEDYIKRRRGETPIKYDLPHLEEILKETYGVILYQEQVMKIANKLANFSMAQADTLRWAMGKKKIEVMEKLEGAFVHGAKLNRIPEKKAAKLFNDMAHFAEYGFNKSHSAAYAFTSYRTVYLKSHYPVEFMAAALSSDMDNTEKVVSYINECKEMNIAILPPDINESERDFKITGNSIRFGLEAVKGVGSSAIEAILEARSGKRFTSFIDFCMSMDSKRVNKKVIESLIKAGAMDSMGKRAQMMFALNSILDTALRSQRIKVSGQGSMFELHQPSESMLPNMEEWKEQELLMMEKEAIGFYITGHPLSRYEEKLKEFSVIPTCELQDMQDKDEVNIGGMLRNIKRIQVKRTGDLMAYYTIEDMYGTVEVTVFSDLYRESASTIAQDTPLLIRGQINKTDKGLKVIARKIVPIEDAIQNPEEFKNAKCGRKVPMGQRPFSGMRNAKLQAPTPNSHPKLTLTLYTDTDSENLARLKDILAKHIGDCPVYLKIISPRQWETLILTEQYVTPSQETISEAEEILGKGTAVLS